MSFKRKKTRNAFWAYFRNRKCSETPVVHVTAGRGASPGVEPTVRSPGGICPAGSLTSSFWDSGRPGMVFAWAFSHLNSRICFTLWPPPEWHGVYRVLRVFLRKEEKGNRDPTPDQVYCPGGFHHIGFECGFFHNNFKVMNSNSLTSLIHEKVTVWNSLFNFP